MESVNHQFRQGAYAYQSRWKGALQWLREQLNEAPSDKVRIALEELVSPGTCSDCKGQRLPFGFTRGTAWWPGNRRVHDLAH